MKSLLAIALVVALPVALGGCMLPGAAAGVLYAAGDLEGTVAASARRVQSAAAVALDDLGLVVARARQDADRGEIIARTPADQRVVVRIRRESEGVTRLSIRVGLLGDQDLSEQIYARVVANV